MLQKDCVLSSLVAMEAAINDERYEVGSPVALGSMLSIVPTLDSRRLQPWRMGKRGWEKVAGLC